MDWFQHLNVRFSNGQYIVGFFNCGLSEEECRNDIGHELIDDNNMIYLPLYIVTRNMYSTTHKLIS